MKNVDERFTPEERAAQTLYWKFHLPHIVKGIYKDDLTAYLPDNIVGKGGKYPTGEMCPYTPFKGGLSPFFWRVKQQGILV